MTAELPRPPAPRGAPDPDLAPGSAEADPRIAELALRWARARAAALRPAGLEEPVDPAAVQALPEDERAAVEKRLYDHSFVLGRGFAHFHRVDLTLVDLERALPQLGAPCARDLARSPGGKSVAARRAPCEAAHAITCALWRESIGGLVSGLSTLTWYSRQSAGAEGGACLDLYHAEARDPERFLPMPAHLQEAWEQVAAKAARVAPSAPVTALGMAEGKLFIRIDTASGGCGLDLHHIVHRVIARGLPQVPVVDASSRSVLQADRDEA